MDGGEYLILSNVLWCPSIHSQATRKLLGSWWTKPGLSTLGWKRSILPRQSEARLEKKKNLPLGISHAIAALRWAVDSHHSSHEPVETWEQLRRCHTVKCNVLCCFSTLKLCSVTTPCRGRGTGLFPDLTPCVFGLKTADCSQVTLWSRAPKTSKTFLTPYRGIRKTFSTGFTVSPHTLRSQHILITHPIMCWAIASFRDTDSAIDSRCHMLSIAKLSTLEHLLKCPIRFTLTNCTEKGHNTQSCVFCQHSKHLWTLWAGWKALSLSIFGVRILLFS